MELSAEINKIFGQEMAKLYANTITEEEMRNKAKFAWQELNQTRNSWSSTSKSDFERELERQVLNKFSEACKAYLETEEVKIDIEKQAKEIVEQIRERAKQKVIESTSDKIAMLYAGDTMRFGLRGYIEEVIAEMARR